MTNANSTPLNVRFARRDTAKRVPVVLALQSASRPRPTISLRVPVTLENRSRLRKLRQAEMLAWKTAGDTTPNGALRAELKSAACAEVQVSRLFGAIMAIGTVATAIGLWTSFGFVQRWADFVTVVRQLLG